MKNTRTNTRRPNLFKKMLAGISRAWAYYSGEVDKAYNRRLRYEDKMEAELCGCGATAPTTKAKTRPIKAAAFEDYSSHY